MIPPGMLDKGEPTEESLEYDRLRGIFSAILLTGLVTLIGITSVFNQESVQKNLHARPAKHHQSAYWHFAKASAGSENTKAEACSHLEAANRHLTSGGMSYEDIGTTKETFEMLNNRFDCRPR